MGLDSYLYRMPRYRKIDANVVNAVEGYFDWQKAKEEESKHINCTWQEYCGADKNILLDNGIINYYKPFYNTKYYAWDTEHNYGHSSIMEEVGY